MKESVKANNAWTSVNEFDLPLGGAQLRVRQLIADAQQPTIVFLHDSLGCIKLWRDFPEQLCGATRTNVLIYDRQGYGASSPFTQERTKDYLEIEADVLVQLVSELKLRKPILFGHSDGGSIALIAAAKVSDMFAAVITEGAHVFVEEITLNGISETRTRYQTTDLPDRLKKYHGDKTAQVFSVWADTWLSPEFRDFNMEHFLPRIMCPVMVVQGVNDEFGSEKQVDSIASQVAGVSRKFMVPAAAHTPHKEATDATVREVSAFLREKIRQTGDITVEPIAKNSDY